MPHPADPTKKLTLLDDPPHIVKNLRGALLKHKIYLSAETVQKAKLPSNCVSIDHVKALVDYQEPLILKIAPYLKPADIDPAHFDKMDTGSALHVYHHDTASALRWLVKEKNYPKSYLTTAWFIDQVAMWFKLVCSRKRPYTFCKAEPDPKLS